MNFQRGGIFSYHSVASMEEDIVIKQLLISHNPDGRRVDSELLIHAVENIMLHAAELGVHTTPPYSFPATKSLTLPREDLIFGAATNITKIEVVGSEEPLGQTIFKLSQKMRCQCFGEGDLHNKILLMFDMLQNYKWEAKLALVLAAFATSYGEFQLLMQKYCNNSLAFSLAMLKTRPKDWGKFKLQFKGLHLLVESMVNITKWIIKFEGLPFSHVELENSAKAITKSNIYVAAYWVVRSTLICSSQITDLIFLNMSKNSDSITIATWELSSLTYQLSNIGKKLIEQVESCKQQIDTKLHQKLLNLFKRTHVNNQEVLHWLFALKEDLPLKQLSEPKIGVSKLINKVVMLLISKPELLPPEDTHFLVQQAYDYPLRTLERSYEIVWVPISFSNSWTDSEEISFSFLSNSLPWYSVRQPWLLNSQVMQFIKEEWNYKDEPIMVALDLNGMVSNLNALDMTFVWGSRAFPFTASKEQELWEEEKWTLQLLLNNIDPLLTKWLEEGIDLCIHGSNNLGWVQQFIMKMEEINRAGVQLKTVYVGWRYPGKEVRTILATLENENICNVLPFTKICFFWLRLESIRRSILRLGKTTSIGQILEEVSTLLDVSDKDHDWIIIGRGNSSEIVKLQGTKFIECLDMFSAWRDKIEILGFCGALETFLEPPLTSGPCGHSYTIPYAEGPTEEIVICDKCKHLKKKFVIYACNENV